MILQTYRWIYRRAGRRILSLHPLHEAVDSVGEGDTTYIAVKLTLDAGCERLVKSFSAILDMKFRRRERNGTNLR
jgi:hypothetical protein